MRILIASGAQGGTSKGSIGKFFHLNEFTKELQKFNLECKLIRESDYVVGFPTKHISKFFSSKKKFQKLIKDFKPDAVFVDRQSNFALEVIKAKIPLFVLLRGQYWSEIDYAKKTIYKDVFMRKIIDARDNVAQKVFANATSILPITSYLIDIVKKHHPEQSTDVFIEGVDDSLWYNEDGMELKHPCVGLLQDANWWGKTKEMLVLENVLSSMPDVHFYWAGDGQYKDKILSKLKNFENFHWLGSLKYPEKVRQYLSEIDVYALITGMDLAPLTLKEAQLMEKPVIATNVGGNFEMMIDKKTGFLVEEGNESELIEKVSYLINNKKMALDMGKNGRFFIQEKFSLEASAKNFISILNTHIS